MSHETESNPAATAAATFLGALVGRWMTRFEAEGLPAAIEGHCECEWVVEGTSILQTLEARMGDAKLRSIRLLAYNPLRESMEAASLEGAGVGIATGSGPVPSDGEPLHLVSRLDEQHAGRLDLAAESVHRILSEREQVLEVHVPAPEGRRAVGTMTFERVDGT